MAFPAMDKDARTNPRDPRAAGGAPEAPWQPAHVGRRPRELDEYQLIRRLGGGGMGSVWLARDTRLDRLVAVKFIAHAQPTRRTRARFAIEARAAARLSHSNVVTVYRY